MEDVDEVTILLLKWNMDNLIPEFSLKGIDLFCLKVMTPNDIASLIPAEKLGLRIKFRHYLLLWRNENVCI